MLLACKGFLWHLKTVQFQGTGSAGHQDQWALGDAQIRDSKPNPDLLMSSWEEKPAPIPITLPVFVGLTGEWCHIFHSIKYNSKYRWESRKKQLNKKVLFVCSQFQEQKRNIKQDSKPNTEQLPLHTTSFSKTFLQGSFTIVFLIMLVRQMLSLWLRL